MRVNLTISKYQKWILEQDKDFISLIHKKKIPRIFKDDDYIGVSLEELEELDNRFINNSPEGGE